MPHMSIKLGNICLQPISFQNKINIKIKIEINIEINLEIKQKYIAYLTLYIPDLNKRICSASSKNKTIGMKSCRCIAFGRVRNL